MDDHIVWKYCYRCGKPCSIVPISIQFDPDGSKYGGMWYCQSCGIYHTTQFLTPTEIKELKEQKIEKISQQELPKKITSECDNDE